MSEAEVKAILGEPRSASSSSDGFGLYWEDEGEGYGVQVGFLMSGPVGLETKCLFRVDRAAASWDGVESTVYEPESGIVREVQTFIWPPGRTGPIVLRRPGQPGPGGGQANRQPAGR